MSDKVVLAYSGGLDTSVAIRWLSERYNLDVIALTIDVGNERDFSTIQQRALTVGAVKALMKDAKDVIGGTAPRQVEQALAAARKIIGQENLRGAAPL